ncbi:hypothetical protein KAFR_0H00900 [Kazachstania africana CBS 2517]|uniref:EF-hand domain-containing protein n=1 Tax=Kazachstania africana (strain ATCC 22294 / BCRC 22015 / CBS 2517 / CECT 1963 / NBRC 1671 / NRRL Y-8276) TaxID=1071382 RepID=H2AYU4_KAZAF|nr:hypothetical protein KAFR_0H00900 [Kazachstania africana CBS 2517]CCF59500.1 hypothetical protein KAFR_0H00900 [Kazachstania africana CBS 2517]
MTAKLTNDQIRQYKEAFDLFDTDHSGSISATELATVMRSLGLNPDESEVEDLINEIDIDGNHEIEFNEFLTLMARQTDSGDSTQELIDAFKVFDKNGDGLISFSELKQVFKSVGEDMSEEDMEQMFQDVTNGSNVMTLSQFMTIFSK